jgi:hypothetical protein
MEQENKSLGTAIINNNKTSPKSYDLKGTFKVNDVTYRFGAYKSTASGNGKLAEGTPYYWMHRIEKLEMQPVGNDPVDQSVME